MRLLSSEVVDRARRRLQQPELAAARRVLHRETDSLLSRDLQPPREPAGFYHDYFCNRHAVELTFDPDQPARHVCPVDQEPFVGDRYDAAWRFGANLLLGRGAWLLAVRWRLEGDERCRQCAEQLLAGYAEHYPGFSVGSVTSGAAPGKGRGRATYQSLDEAHLLLALARAYDLLREDVPPSSRAVVERDLLAPGLRHLREERFQAVHNIECWHLAAIVSLAALLDEPDVVAEAMAGEWGIGQQLEEGVRGDGLWWEGSSSYHYYAAAPLLVVASFDDEIGGRLRGSDRLQGMLRAPVKLVQPDGRLPATNHCWLSSSLIEDVCHGIPPAAALYDMGAGCWPDEEAFAQVLTANYGGGGSSAGERDSVEALLHGPDRIGPTGDLAVASHGAETSGLAMLRSPHPLQRQTSCLLKFGPHGGGHGHPDKLAVSIYLGGQDASVDLGTAGYGIGLNEEWYRQTVSHNTALVGGEPQPPVAGRLVRFEAGGDPARPAVAAASVGWDDEQAGRYRGVRMLRTVGVREGYLVDCFAVAAPEPRRIDLVMHVQGALANVDGLIDEEAYLSHPAALLDGPGWGHFAPERSGRGADVAQATWQLSAGAGMTLLMP